MNLPLRTRLLIWWHGKMADRLWLVREHLLRCLPMWLQERIIRRDVARWNAKLERHRATLTAMLDEWDSSPP